MSRQRQALRREAAVTVGKTGRIIHVVLEHQGVHPGRGTDRQLQHGAVVVQLGPDLALAADADLVLREPTTTSVGKTTISAASS